MPRSPALKMTEDSFTDGDDEILESLVKTATSTPRTTPRERKRTRNVDRKSCKCLVLIIQLGVGEVIFPFCHYYYFMLCLIS